MRYRRTSIALFLAVFAASAAGSLPTVTFETTRGSARAESLERAPVVAHEWGTFTSIAGEDGTPVEWLPQAGPSDLPCFVHRSPLTPKAFLFATVRMETPVLYFYSQQEATLDVSIGFKQGVITEWFPRAAVTPGGSIGPLSRDPGFEGRIEWRDVKIMPGAMDDFPTEVAPSHYYPARQTDASPLQVKSEKEKFLFYRGVSRFPVPLSATLQADGRVVVTHRNGESLGSLLLFRNHGGSIAYELREEPGASTTFDALEAEDESTAPLADLERVLVAIGLYPREAKAMVETWRDSWFEDGLRLIYIMPQPAVEAILPLDITPKPTDITRVFVGRIELVTPEVQQEVKQALLAGDRATLQKHGRFLQPIGQRLVAASSPSERPSLERLLQLQPSAWTTPAAGCKTSQGGAAPIGGIGYGGR